MAENRIRLAVEIGGTFTDVALAMGEQTVTSKVLTTPAAPEEGVMTGIARVMETARIRPEQIAVVIHGTTLATNAIIEPRSIAKHINANTSPTPVGSM